MGLNFVHDEHQLRRFPRTGEAAGTSNEECTGRSWRPFSGIRTYLVWWSHRQRLRCLLACSIPMFHSKSAWKGSSLRIW